jgi:multiple sugar transport system substrate-binding protein
MLGEGRSQDFWHLPEYSEMLAVQQEAFNGYATGTVSSAAEALDYSAAKQQEILFNAGRTTVAPPEGTAERTLQ